MNIKKGSSKKLIIGLASLSLFLGLTGCGTNTSSGEPVKEQATEEVKKEKKPLEVFNAGYVKSSGHALYFIGLEKGFFAEQGFDLKLHSFPNGGEGINAVVAGKLDTGAFGTAAPLAFLEKGADVNIYGGVMGTGQALITRQEDAEAFKNFTDLNGKKIGTIRLSTGDAVIQGVLNSKGYNVKEDVEIVEMDAPKTIIEAIKKGNLDAGVLYTPFGEVALKEGLAVASYSTEWFPDHPCCRLIATTEQLEKNPEKYTRFLKAMIKAEKFKAENKAETIEIVKKYVNVEDEILEKDLYGGYQESSANPNGDGVLQFAEQMDAVGYLENADIVNGRINTDIYSNAISELLEENPNDPFYLKAKEKFESSNQHVHEH